MRALLPACKWQGFLKVWGKKKEFPNMLDTEIQVIYSHQFQNKILETILILLPSHEFIILVSRILDSQYLD